MEKIDENLKKELVFHEYGRYSTIFEIINKNRSASEKFKILDVGGRGNLMKKFFPKDEVFFLDPFVDSNDKNFIKGDGCEIPFENESFDWLVSTDVFEHIPKEKRNDFLKENLRVSKIGVVLVAPFYSKEVENAEINANENYKNLFGKDHIWLKEHIENKLPRAKDLESYLTERKIEFNKFHNNRLFLWQTLIANEFFIEKNLNEQIIKENKKFNYFYNTEINPFDNQEPSYRKIYFLKKRKGLKSINVENNYIDNSLFLETLKRSFNILAQIDLQKNKEALYCHEEIEKLNKDILEKNRKIEKLNKDILEKNRKIEKLNGTLSNIESSKFWKIRKKYLAIKKLFSRKS